MLALAGLAASAVAQFDGVAPVAWRWAETTSAPPAGAPLVDGDQVFVAVGGRIYSVNRKTGNQNWRFPVAEPLDGNFRTGAALAGNLIVGATDARIVYAVDKATGALKWQHPAEAPVAGTPVIAGNAVVYATTDRSLVALNLDSGSPLWPQPVKAANGIYPNLAAWQDSVIYMTNEPQIISMNVATKKENWRIGLRSLSAATQLVAYGDSIYVASGNYISAIRAASGGRKGEVRLDKTLSFGPAVSANGVAVVSDDGYVFTFDANLKPVFRAGINLESLPVNSPGFVGKWVVVPTTNGSVNVLDPTTGDIVFNYIVPPLFKVAADGGGDTPPARFVTASGPAAESGSTMLVLLRDGSLVAFDSRLGVDLTPPEISMLWPRRGEQISGAAPLEFLFQIDDASSGVNSSSLKVYVDDKEYEGVYSRDGYLSVKIAAGGRNQPLTDGRHEIRVVAKDWLGNEATQTVNVSVDNTLAATGLAPRKSATEGTGGAGGRRRGGAAGGG
ncbi:MAG: PQQ-binding-like beta-propeller repeat protein [Fimbriimonadaceae bacterium]|nr:PQQ-binding-like beta-propeller repeat protein [Fimbriimonadaceae bacterium]QYK56028.1 MAG: PQQ-binding-like beta-propeller repeat protein [Fimbriimonadaceae bacterium]